MKNKIRKKNDYKKIRTLLLLDIAVWEILSCYLHLFFCSPNILVFLWNFDRITVSQQKYFWFEDHFSLESSNVMQFGFWNIVPSVCSCLCDIIERFVNFAWFYVCDSFMIYMCWHCANCVYAMCVVCFVYILNSNSYFLDCTNGLWLWNCPSSEKLIAFMRFSWFGCP